MLLHFIDTWCIPFIKLIVFLPLIFLCCFVIYSDFSYFSPQFFRLLGWILGAVLEISAVSATFLRNFSGFWAEFWVLFWRFLRFQLLFSQFFRLLGWILGAVLKVLGITAPQGLPTMLSTYSPLKSYYIYKIFYCPYIQTIMIATHFQFSLLFEIG